MIAAVSFIKKTNVSLTDFVRYEPPMGHKSPPLVKINKFCLNNGIEELNSSAQIEKKKLI